MSWYKNNKKSEKNIREKLENMYLWKKIYGSRKSFKTRYNIDEATCAKQDEWL